MDTKSKRFSHSIFVKCLVFLIMVVCFTGSVKSLVDLIIVDNGDMGVVFEDNYFHSESYIRENNVLIDNLTMLMNHYKNEENVLSGKTVSKNQLNMVTEELYWNYRDTIDFDHNLSEQEILKKFEEEHGEEISQVKESLIKSELADYNSLLKQIKQVENPIYYASYGKQIYTNSSNPVVEQFKSYPAYTIIDGNEKEFYPTKVNDNQYLDWITSAKDDGVLEDQSIYIGFTEAFLNSKVNEWTENKQATENALYGLTSFLIGFIISFIYLLIVSGRKKFHDKKAYLNSIDSLFVDLNIVISGGLIVLYILLLNAIQFLDISKWVVPITVPVFIAVFMLLFSLIRHIKNGTFLKHTLIYRLISPVAYFVKNVYNHGNLAIKVVLIVIGYPLLIAATFFMFPITIGIAAWFVFKKVQSFEILKDGVERIRQDDIQHKIDIAGDGEFSKLATNINGIADELESAVNNELKSERLKAELITNVSHDIRTPLTSIITYVDLLKTEEDPSKMNDYINVLDQKSKRLKELTDDLFDATKASSGNIPVNFEQLELASLITQGLGEVSDQIEETELKFKFNQPDENFYIMADGKLLWRSIENLLSNVFKYSQTGSRVYVSIEESGEDVLLVFKNISSYELNITADELMERFKRGDESRTTQGSGLGLSITKSLIEIQRGKFKVEIDGDLFKAMIYLPKYPSNI